MTKHRPSGTGPRPESGNLNRSYVAVQNCRTSAAPWLAWAALAWKSKRVSNPAGRKPEKLIVGRIKNLGPGNDAGARVEREPDMVMLGDVVVNVPHPPPFWRYCQSFQPPDPISKSRPSALGHRVEK